MEILELLFGAFVGGIIWRIRGGGLQSLINPEFKLGGTNTTRLLCATLYGIYIAVFADLCKLHPLPIYDSLLIITAIFLGWAVNGWGTFQGIGLNTGFEKSPFNWLPQKIGFSIGSVEFDYVGLMQCGFVCSVFISLVLGIFTGEYTKAVEFIINSVFFMPSIYFICNSSNIPTIQRFIPNDTCWAEFFMGMFFLFNCLLFFVK